MKTVIIPALAAALALAAPAMAKNNNFNPSTGHCPPGLAKKNPPCIPPGLAKKFHIGQVITDQDFEDFAEYLLWRELGLERPRTGSSYYRVGDALLLVDRDTRELLNLIDAIVQVLD